MRLGQVLMFIAIVLLVVGGMHFFLWARLFRDPAWPAPWPHLGRALLWALALSLPLTLFSSRWLPRALSTPLAWVVFVWLGTAFVLFVLLSLGEALRRLAGGGSVLGALHDPARRQWFLPRRGR